jgi:hypothetical protein
LDGDLLGLFDGDLDNLDNLLGDLLGLMSRHLEGDLLGLFDRELDGDLDGDFPGMSQLVIRHYFISFKKIILEGDLLELFDRKLDGDLDGDLLGIGLWEIWKDS